MGKVRDWPLTDAERELVADAWLFAESSLDRVKHRFPSIASDVESEFAYQVCTNLHKWDRRRSLYQWVIFRLRKSVSLVWRRQPSGDRSPGGRCGVDIYPIESAQRNLARINKRNYDDLIDHATDRLPGRTAIIVRLAAQGHSRVEIARIVGIEKSNVFKHLARAKSVVTEALS